jgi:hypothetical protein
MIQRGNHSKPASRLSIPDQKRLEQPQCDDEKPAGPQQLFLYTARPKVRRPANLSAHPAGLNQDPTPINEGGGEDNGLSQE